MSPFKTPCLPCRKIQPHPQLVEGTPWICGILGLRNVNVYKNQHDNSIRLPARVSSHIDSEKWKASLIARERFFLKLFKLIKLHRPIRVHTREEIVKAIEDTPFKKYWIHEKDNEIKIKLQK